MRLETFKVRLVKDYEVAAAYSQGTADLLFCIHGLGCSYHSFRDLEAQPTLQKCSTLVPDLFGFGNSGRSQGFSYSMEAHAELCAGLLRQFHYERLHLVAHSMGGAIALLLPPELLNSAASFANVEGNLTSADCGLASRRAAGVTYEKFKAEILPEYMVKFGKYLSLDLASPIAYYRSACSLVEWSDSGKLLDKFLNLRCRKCYFYADQNRHGPSVAATGGMRQVEIKGSGHFIMDDNPGQFYAELAKFIGEPG
jgi:pimeloyl-ACP methyl ester carboxylesterase